MAHSTAIPIAITIPVPIANRAVVVRFSNSGNAIGLTSHLCFGGHARGSITLPVGVTD